MSKKVLLVGHCGPDSSYLRMAVKKAGGDVTLLAADDPDTLNDVMSRGVDLVLFNRELGYDFDPTTGVDLIRQFKKSHPNLKTMLISNFPEAQEAATKAGAMAGFGKREIGSPRVTKLLQDVLADSQ